jgi:predicted dehydrogenase
MGCSSFAQRAMLPAIASCPALELACVASRSPEKARAAAERFGCEAVVGYDALLARPDLDAIYMPLPTGLHEEWCAKALQAGKHLLVEKSFAPDLPTAERLLTLARQHHCLVQENFQFQTHCQWRRITDYFQSGELGHVHLVRACFGFPPLPKDNFRWNAALGGGALLDAGAYMCKASQLLLGTGLELLGASLTMDPETGVDKYGEAMFRNHAGQVAQVAFGFDYFYQCRVELLGTTGKMSTNRVFTAPPDLETVFLVEKPQQVDEVRLPPDNHFVNMWNWFAATVASGNYDESWLRLRDQARLLSEIREKMTKASGFE